MLELLGGVMAIKGRFADGSLMLAIPNFARVNRTPGLPLPPRRQAATPGGKAPEPPHVV